MATTEKLIYLVTRNESVKYTYTNPFFVQNHIFLCRILAVGWNQHVTEFEDSGTAMTGKSWEVRHSDDVLAAAVRPPLTLVTSSYNSEMVMWKLETGQPYRLHH